MLCGLRRERSGRARRRRGRARWRRGGAAGSRILDLTASNPTQCGFSYDAQLLAELSAEGARQYDPDPRGMLAAREAVCGYYTDHGAHIGAEQIVLTTSTSEGYSWLFRLLCDPGDEVLIAQPSYPLFDLLATIDDVRLVPYPLLYDPGGSHGWSLDLHTLRAADHAAHAGGYRGASEQSRPGTSLRLPSGRRSRRSAHDHGLALIVDEVFLDYPLPGHEAAAASFTRGSRWRLPLC